MPVMPERKTCLLCLKERCAGLSEEYTFCRPPAIKKDWKI
jgi:hypothetical protein